MPDPATAHVDRPVSMLHMQAHNIHQMLANLINQMLVIVVYVCKLELMCCVHNKAIFNTLYGSTVANS